MHSILRRAGSILLNLLIFSAPALAQDFSPAAESEKILDSVNTIAFPGIPGAILVTGESAWTLIPASVNGKEVEAPLVAASCFKKSRVILFGHTGYFDRGNLETADSARLFSNAMAWASQKKDPRVGVLGAPSLARAIKDWAKLDSNIRPRLVEVPSTATTKKILELKEIDLLCLGQEPLSAAEIAVIRAFLESGGGLIAAATGWGWLQLNPGKDLAEHPLNQLLSGYGLTVTESMLEPRPESPGLQSVSPWSESHRMLNASQALKHIEESRESDSPKSRQALWTASLAARSTLVDDDSLIARFEKLEAAREPSFIPKADAPLTQKRALERLLLAFRCARDERAPASAIKAHPASAFFPGSVPEGAELLNDQSIRLEPGRTRWHSTGLYLPPGKILKIEIPEAGIKDRLSVQIGCHSDLLWDKPFWSRVPDIICRRPLNKTTIEAASAFGGLVYIDSPRKSAGLCQIKLSGAVQAPRFVLGLTRPEEWKTKLRLAPGPWAELESKHVIVTVPSSEIRALEDPSSVLELWDQISELYADFAAIPKAREWKWRYVADVQISAGYMHSGYPIMTHLDAAADMVQFEKLKAGSWGLLHELGHNHQEPDWTFAGTTEVTCNIFALRAIDKLCKLPPGKRGHDAVNNPPSLIQYIKKGRKFEQWKADPFLALQFYIQLEKAFGWDVFQRVFRDYRELKDSERPKSDEEKRDQWLIRFSRRCARNLGPFFDAWGIPVSEKAKASLAELPKWMPEDWPE